MDRKIIRKNNNILIKYGIITFTMAFVIMILGFNDINLDSIMGNSVIDKYYYCLDDSYELKSNKCYKKDYQDAILIGDVNSDSEIDIEDVYDIQLYLKNKKKFDKTQLLVADVNNDEIINLKDIEILQIFIANRFNKEENTNSISGTTGKSYEAHNLGVDKVCSEGYRYDKKNDRCEKQLIVKALEAEFIMGDVNADGKVDLDDTKIISNYLNGSTNLSKIQLKASDVNKDNVIDINDLNYINDYLIEKEESSVNASVIILSNVDIKNLEKNFKLILASKFDIKGSKEYYYKWFDIKNNNTIESNCSLISGKSSRYTINATDDNEYVMLRIYSDEKCEEEINSYKSDEIGIKKIPNEIYMSYKLASPTVTGNIVNKNIKLMFNAKFTITGNSDNKFYYRWKAIKNGKVYNPIGCYLITDGMERDHSLTINGKDQYGIWEIYNNSMCNSDGLVKKYETKHYDYYADSINLNINSKKINVGDNLNLEVKVKSNLSNANSLVRWDSSNVAVATVDSNGVVTAKKSGSATITASIGNLNAKSVITVVEKGKDTSIVCPGIVDYEVNGDNVSMTITPKSIVKTYDIYYSTNMINGSWAKWKIEYNNVTGDKSITINKNNTTQVKIVAKSDDGTTRNCYSASFITRNYTPSSIAKCPNFTYSDSKSGMIRNYRYDGYEITSGIKKRTAKVSLNSDYQYTWFIQNKDGSYRPGITYYTSVKDISPTITAQKYNRRGMLMVTDKFGNITNCYTKGVNNLNLSKKTYGNTDVYIESGFSSDDEKTVFEQMNIMNKKSPAYIAATSVFLLKTESYLDIYGKSCGNYRQISNVLILSESKNRNDGSSCGGNSNSNYYKGAVNHEFGHSMDHMNDLITGTSLSNSSYFDKAFKSYTEKYNENKKQCNGDFCLRYRDNYTYGNSYWEFLADIISYDSHGFKVNQELLNLNNEVLKKYISNYNSNKTKFNQIKESFR